MKIAIVSSLYKPTRSDVIGGQEVWTATFAEMLSKKNNVHTDLYALPDSISSSKITLKPITEKSLDVIKNTREDLVKHIPTIRATMYASIAPKLIIGDYDVIVDSTGEVLIPIVVRRYLKKTPIVTIGHFPVEANLGTHIYTYLTQENHHHFVFPSNFQFRGATWLNNKHLIPHGILVKDFVFKPKPKYESAFWVGRLPLKDVKGGLEAVQLFTKLQKGLRLYGAFDSIDNYNDVFKPLSKGSVEVINTYNDHGFDKLVTPGDHKFLVYPLQWDEPFGLVLLEAMACGTPIIAYGRGAIPEIVKDGVTGFLVNPSEDDIRGDWIVKKTGKKGLMEAVEKIYAMAEGDYEVMRRNSRNLVEREFQLSKMVDDYYHLFSSFK